MLKMPRWSWKSPLIWQCLMQLPEVTGVYNPCKFVFHLQICNCKLIVGLINSLTYPSIKFGKLFLSSEYHLAFISEFKITKTFVVLFSNLLKFLQWNLLILFWSFKLTYTLHFSKTTVGLVCAAFHIVSLDCFLPLKNKYDKVSL